MNYKSGIRFLSSNSATLFGRYDANIQDGTFFLATITKKLITVYLWQNLFIVEVALQWTYCVSAKLGLV